MIEKYYSRGKLLLTGEYLVITGAKALALPVNLGQSLEIKPNPKGNLKWSTSELGLEIFSAEFNRLDFSIQNCSDIEKAIYVSKLLTSIRLLSPKFLIDSKGYSVIADIEFNMNWGLGSSSTLINNLAQWAKVNPFELNALISKGSGYDIACALANTPITYQLVNKKPEINQVEFDPPFLNKLTLVYLNKKMATENNINTFLQNTKANYLKIDQLNALTQDFISCNTLKTFLGLMGKHEYLIGSVVNKMPIKQQLFSEFDGAIKSLGAWGGDFVLAASENSFEKQRDYFNNKGYTTVIPLQKLMI